MKIKNILIGKSEYSKNLYLIILFNRKENTCIYSEYKLTNMKSSDKKGWLKL